MSRPKKLHDGLPRFTRVCGHLLPRMRRHPSLVITSMIALFSGIALRLIEPVPLMIVIDTVIQTPETPTTITRWLANIDPNIVLAGCAIAVVATTTLRALADYRKTVGFALLANRVLTEVRGDVFRHLQGLSLRFHDRSRHGDLTVRVIGDVNMLKDAIVSAVLPLVASVLLLGGMIGVMFWTNSQLTLLALSVAPLFYLTTVRLSRKIHQSAQQQRRRQGDMAATVAESMGAMKVVQSLSIQGVFDKGFAQHSNRSQKEGVKTSRLSARLERTIDVLISLASALVLWWGASMVLQGEMSAGLLVLFLLYLKKGFRPLQDFAKYASRLAKATAAGERVVEILEQTPEVCDSPAAIIAPPLAGQIGFNHVTFAYDAERVVLNALSLNIPAGQTIAIIGPSGIGKSTFINLLLRLYDPQSGSITIDGQDIRNYTLNSLRSQMSVVLQENTLFAADVWDNIAFGSDHASPDQVEAAARLANAHDFIMDLPNAYDTILGERGATLSQGQRQRIAIARAAIRRTPILLLDEPTTGLDGESKREVVLALDRLARKATTIIVTHDLTLAANADRVIHLRDGMVAEQGTHDELILASGKYAKLHGLQAESRRP